MAFFILKVLIFIFCDKPFLKMKSLFVASFFASCLLLPHVSSAQRNLIPQPQFLQVKDQGQFQLNNSVSQFDITDFQDEGKFLIENFNNIPLKNAHLPANNGKIRLKKIQSSDVTAKPGYYELTVDGSGVTIAANNPQGALYGVETFLQLVKENANKGSISFLDIKDYPKFPYRGMHLDVCRHFFTKDEVKSYLDYLATYKINKFHWHLTDDQGWRIEIKSHPKLTEIGAYRRIKPGQEYSKDRIVDGKYGGYYTQEDIKEVVAYAKKLHIDVIPEIEMPGHAQAALAAYPELSCTGGPFEVWTEWGVSENVYCPKEETFDFLEDVLDEVMELFPSKYIHIGGDEAPKTRWKACAHCQELIKKEGLNDEHGLQSYFITRMEKYLNSKGRSIIGWDEILEGGLAPNATVMSWTGQEGAIHAAKQGNDAIMTPVSHVYFDYYQGNAQTEPLAFNAEVRLEKAYSFNPIPKELTEAEAKHILGPQANLWAERIQDFKHVEFMIFPRLFALSEVAWGTSKPEEYSAFEKRAIHHMDYLESAGINFSKALFEVSGSTYSESGKNFYQLQVKDPAFVIRYTTDGSMPTSQSAIYNAPIEINRTMEVKSASFDGAKQKSTILTQQFLKSKSTGKAITLENEPSTPYTANGASSLVDGIFGHPYSFKSNWLGFNGKDVVAIIDLARAETIENVKLNTLDFTESWIHGPKSVTVFVSQDGKRFKEVKKINQEEIVASKGSLELNFAKTKAKFVKVVVENVGKIPEGFPGAGYDAWLFVDELTVQ